MKVFLSSTLLDLVNERKSVLLALDKKGQSTLAMEYFGAVPKRPLETALDHLRKADLMILVIGNKAGSLLPDGSGKTYTSAEFDELLRLDKEALVFVKVQRLGFGGSHSPWQNKEEDLLKRKALDDFKAKIGTRFTWDYFSNRDNLALGVIQALDRWEANGRPGARQTFASTQEYFSGKNPAGYFHLLDFGTNLLGRENEMRSLREFSEDPAKRVCILSGRGGLGKSKILHDWANLASGAMFLKDEPLWHEDSEKEIPIAASTVIVDDAHRQATLEKILQLLMDVSKRRNLKLIVSTRPGSVARLAQRIYRSIDIAQVTQLPEITDLDARQSRALAGQVLGLEFSNYASHLAQISGGSPLVIVAGGRLIATKRVHPSALVGEEDFRSTLFGRFLEEMNLQGPKFEIDPPNPVLNLIAALGPVDVEASSFQQSAQNLLGRPIDEILKTIDALACNGIITQRGKPVRVLPDVLSDYILEVNCLSAEDRTTGYADRVYEEFGAHSLESLMRNLAELDWRRGELVGSKLNLLNKIWGNLSQRFLGADEYERHRMLSELASAAIYQPIHVLALIRTAINEPIQPKTNTEGSLFRAGQDYVLLALPDLLEATAQHPDQLEESIELLWDLTGSGSASSGAKSVLKRLASWRRFGDVALNFAMLLQAIRLSKRTDALIGSFTPFAIINQLLEREGEFTEHPEEYTITLGSFGLNHAAVGPIRDNTLDYLEFVLAEDGRPAVIAVELIENLLPYFLNHAGRISSDEESTWQDRERERCLKLLQQRFVQPSSLVLKARLYDAVRSATSLHRPESIRERAETFLAQVEIEDSVTLLDAICTAEHELPRLTFEFNMAERESSIAVVVAKATSALDNLASDDKERAKVVIANVEACIAWRVKTSGFHDLVVAFSDRPGFLTELLNQFASSPRLTEMFEHFSSVFFALHLAEPAGFRQRALLYLENHNVLGIRAAARSLRAFENATEDDVSLIHAFCIYPDSEAKQGALFAIAYMGKFLTLRSSLKKAALAVRSEGNISIAAKIATAFGPYGLALTDLTRSEAVSVAAEFLFVEDWETNQGDIPSFLNRFVKLFPGETYDLLQRRIEISAFDKHGKQTSFSTFRLANESVSFDGVPIEKRLELAKGCLAVFFTQKFAVEAYAQLYWSVGGYTNASFKLIIESASTADPRAVQNLAKLIEEAVPRLAFTSPDFAGELLQRFTGDNRAKLLDAFAYQASRLKTGVRSGSYEDHIAEHRREFASRTASFPSEPKLKDLAAELRRIERENRGRPPFA